MAEKNKDKQKKTEGKDKVEDKKTEEKKEVKETKQEKKVGDKKEKSEKEKPEKDVKKDEGKKEDKKDEKKKVEEKKKPEVKKPKKAEAFVNASNIPISTKQSVAICKFIKNKPVKKAMEELEQVLVLKKAIPMKGEIPHRKGKGMMSGRFPVKATKNFISLLKTLSGNAIYNGIEEPVIVEAVANIGSRPYGRFGRVRKKRTHVKIIAKEKTGGKK